MLNAAARARRFVQRINAMAHLAPVLADDDPLTQLLCHLRARDPSGLQRPGALRRRRQALLRPHQRRPLGQRPRGRPQRVDQRAPPPPLAALAGGVPSARARGRGGAGAGAGALGLLRPRERRDEGRGRHRPDRQLAKEQPVHGVGASLGSIAPAGAAAAAGAGRCRAPAGARGGGASAPARGLGGNNGRRCRLQHGGDD